MTTHWTSQSIEAFAFRIAADFIAQLEDKMESIPISQKELAKILGRTKGRVSQIFNNPGNLSLEKIVAYSKALNMKVAVVAYTDYSPGDDNGPINSDIFRICWEKSGKPRDFWAFEKKDDQIQAEESHALVATTVAANNDAQIRYEPLQVTAFYEPLMQYRA